MDHQSFAYPVITLRTRHLHATTQDPKRNAAAWQATLHDELGSGAYKDIVRRIIAQTENCPPNPSIADLNERWRVNDYFRVPDDIEEPEMSLDEIKQRLGAQGIQTDFEPPKDLDYLRTLASVACGVNQTVEWGLARMREGQVMDILRLTVTDLEGRSNTEDGSIQFLIATGGCQYALAMAYMRPQKARELDSNSGGMESNSGGIDSNSGGIDSNSGGMDSNSEGKTILPLRLKNSEVSE